jgi:hypothetical protein
MLKYSRFAIFSLAYVGFLIAGSNLEALEAACHGSVTTG